MNHESEPGSRRNLNFIGEANNIRDRSTAADSVCTDGSEAAGSSAAASSAT